MRPGPVAETSSVRRLVLDQPPPERAQKALKAKDQGSDGSRFHSRRALAPQAGHPKHCQGEVELGDQGSLFRGLQDLKSIVAFFRTQRDIAMLRIQCRPVSTDQLHVSGKHEFHALRHACPCNGSGACTRTLQLLPCGGFPKT